MPILLVGQDQNALEKKRKKLENEINQTQKAIQQTQQTRDNSLKEIVNLEKQIQLRKELIDNTTKEVKGFSGQIQDIYSELKVLETNLEQLRQNYGLAIYGTFKSYRMADQLMFIASSNSFSDALRRLNYLRKIGDYRKTQVDEIVNTQTNINAKLALIQDKKNKQESLLSQQKNQEHALTKNKSQKALLVDQLKVKESKLNVELDKKRKEAEKLNAQIQAIIAKEIERQRKLEEERKRKEAEAIAAAAKEKAKTPSSTSTKETKTTTTAAKTPVYSSTPEVARLSSSFAANKGKLPWPVERGTVSRGFGPYKHPIYGGDMDNKGIDIKTEKSANVRAVFEGKVISVVNNPIYKNAVIVSHGDFFTVYTKLESVNVSKGQTISAKQVIGKVYTDEDTNETEMHFELWQGNVTQNPAYWIAR